MKKFKFALEPLSKVRETEKKQKQAELAKAQETLDLLIAHEQSLKANRARVEEAYHNEISTGVAPNTLVSYGEFFMYIRNQLKQAAIQIQRARERLDKVREELVAIVKELKALERLRETQYEQYLVEVRLEEEKELGDILSHKQTMDE